MHLYISVLCYSEDLEFNLISSLLFSSPSSALFQLGCGQVEECI